MDCAAFDERFLSIISASSVLSAQLSAEVRNTLAQCDSPSSVYLDTLSRLALHPAFAPHILACYEPLLPELVARWRTFSTIDQMAAGFGRILPVVPYLADMAEFFLLQTPGAEKPYFLNITKAESASNGPATPETLLALHRLLCFKRDSFLALVDSANLYTLLQNESRPTRYLAIRILCMHLGVADAMQETLFEKHGVGRNSDAILGKWEGQEIDYGFLQILEGQRFKALSESLVQARENISAQMAASNPRILQSTDLSPAVADLCGIITPRLRGAPQNSVSIIDTSTTRRNVHDLAFALRSSAPVLVTGHAGSGKTTLIHQIADTLNALDTMVSVHLGDQTDAKLLIGTYTTSTHTPGSFEWRPGVLATAVREGRWVLVEDIDKAPTEVLGVLLPLIERGELLLPSRGEKIKAARGFRLVATVRTSASAKTETPNITLLGNRLWNRVNVTMPPLEELQSMIQGKFPLLRTIANPVMNVYSSIQSLYEEPSFYAISKSTLARHISPRDLFKWCTRINVLFNSAGVKAASEALPEGLFDEVFSEAVDCFAGSLHTLDARRLVVGRIAEELHVPSQRLEMFLTGHTPSLKDSDRSLVVGRAKLKKKKAPSSLKRRKTSFGPQKRPFATTSHALRLMEQIGVAVRLAEPVLLVGETGTGKTTIVQHLADMLGYSLTAINLSQQTESGDLLGGYKPVDVKSLAVPLKDTFESLFDRTFSAKKNKRFIEVLAKCWAKQQWKSVIKLWGEAIKMAENTLNAVPVEKPLDKEEPQKKRKLDLVDKAALQAQWIQFTAGVSTLEKQSSQLSKSFAFSFVEGALVKAARNGDWVLLDEINLASPDTLESIADLLKDGGNGSIILSEKGDVERIRAHPDFRIFACMNPATDVGKRDLPSSLRSRFTELYVANPDTDLANLLAIVNEYIGHLAIGDERVPSDVALLYLEAKKLAEENKLVDGANQRPHFSIRTLTRTMSYVTEIAGVYGLRRSLYEGFCMSFLTLLNQASERLLLPVIDKFILGNQKNVRSWINQIPKRPTDGDDYVQFKHYWMRKGAGEPQEQPHYIITPFVERNMLNLVRATATRKFPVLVQGPTSSGKTSMIEYLAKRTGNKFVRINNHEHTDLQEYMGTYVSDNDGQLTFREGILVDALRKGHWIVLDELNLAPTDVLEALNRLLDDNRELLIPETQEVVRPHKNFMLFATQNPPGLYGGRKNLSRAFRNRFLELHFDDIPEEELGTILRERCQIAPSYCERIVKVYKELSLLRQSTRLFEQKNSFATLRDLFRWANREAVGYQQLAENGYMLLAERVRKDEEKQAVRGVLEKVMRVTIKESDLYILENLPEYALYAEQAPGTEVVWTKAMMRLFSLVSYALRNNEPVLLVGETGCGKTTVCQMLAEAFKRRLVMVNAHQNTETGDIIGAQRPKRNRSKYSAELVEDLTAVLQKYTDIEQEHINNADVKVLLKMYQTVPAGVALSIPTELRERIELNRVRSTGLFEWADGPLIQAMKEGSLFLLDEISLADDSVLERLNSVLEPARTILLAEKGPIESKIKGQDGFQFLATMNPGGDYGKKELSPALRNRFTEIWVPAMTDYDDVLQIVTSKLKNANEEHASAIVKYAQWFSQTYNFSNSQTISIRDILAWIRFVNLHADEHPMFGLLHGAALIYFDGLGANPSAVLSMRDEDLPIQKQKCVEKLSELLGEDLSHLHTTVAALSANESIIKLGAFSLGRKAGAADKLSFNLTAPTTSMNAMRVMRAMQLHRPILLEGSPGVGKTSLITALANATGNPLTRINLSEQTDLMDLFGSDVPVEGGQSGEFAWRDAPFLRAMQTGDWVLLDEMNLASQSVLEGLNACLDHRGEAYIAELDRTFHCHPNFVVFAAQNPHHQGGGRKGLPASFVNRFTVVYVEPLEFQDLQMIATKLYPSIPESTVDKLINFVVKLEHALNEQHSFGTMGGPWEFNLRDTLRWLELLASTDGLPAAKTPVEYVDMVIKQRFRTLEDRKKVDQIFSTVFGMTPQPRHFYHQLSDRTLQVGHAVLARHTNLQDIPADGLGLLKRQLPVLETLMTCIEKNMPVILAGPSGVGKSSMINLLAGILGAELEQLALNNDVDTTDILGGFEQVDLSRKVAKLLDDLQRFLRVYIVEAVNRGELPDVAITQMMGICRSPTLFSDVVKLTLLLNLLKEAYGKSLDFAPFITCVEEMVAKAQRAKTARFEWVDGMLIRAVEEGKWLVLDNSNLCSPSVLDRLNSLLEVGGELVVNEHSTASGDPKIVKPHPNFRLFITMDPKHGELSRAMRNRCIEVYVHPATTLNEIAQEDEKEIEDLAKYEVSTEADMVAFQRVARITKTTPDNAGVFENLARAVYEHIPRNGHQPAQATRPSQLLSRWSTMLASVQDGTQLQGHQALNNFIQFANHPRVLQVVYQALQATSIETNLPEPFNDAQPLVPLRNSYLCSSFDDFTAISTFFEVIRQILEIRDLEEGIVAKSTTGKLAEMTFIEKSASRRGKNTGFGGSVGVHLFEFLSTIRQLLEGLVNADTVIPKEAPAMMQTLVVLWRDMVRLSDTTSLDESIFHVYLWLFDEWVHLARAAFGAEAMFVDAVEAALKAFKEPLHLVTGLSMEPMWDAMRPSVPRDLQAWEQYTSLTSVMERFDKIGADGNIATVLASRKALVEAITLLLTENADVSELVTAMEQSVTRLEATKIEGVKEYTGGVFSSAFDLLLKLQAVQGWKEDEGITDDTLKLAHYAGRSTANLLGYQSKTSGVKTAFEQFLEDIWVYPKSDVGRQGNGGILSGRITTEMLRIGTSAKNSTIGQLHELDTEMLEISKQFASQTTVIVADQITRLGVIVLKKLEQIMVVHEETYDVEKYSSAIEALRVLAQTDLKAASALYRTIKDSLASTSCTHLVAITAEHLIPALEALENVADPATLNNERITAAGTAYIHYAMASLKLYVPNVAFDPAQKPMIQRDRYLIRKTEINDELEAEKLFELKYTGADDNMRIQFLNQRLGQLGQEPVNSMIARPLESQMSSLQGDLSNLLNVVVAGESHKKLLALILERAPSHKTQENILQINLSQIVERLQNGYLVYKDIVDPILGFIYTLKLGLSLAAANTEGSPLQDASPFLDPLSEVQVNMPVPDSVGRDVRLLWLQKLAARSATEGYETLPKRTQEQVDEIFQLLFDQWKNETEEDKFKAAQKASMYRYRGEGEDFDQTDFAAMFPDYESETPAEEETEQLKERGSDSHPEHHLLASKIAQAHSALFLGKNELDTSLAAMMQTGANLWTKSTGDNAAYLEQDQIGEFLPAILLSLKESKEWIKGHGHDPRHYDFYTHENLGEAQRLVKFATRTLQRVSQILEVWPEHATLLDAFETCQQLLEFPNDTPVAKFITKVEKLHGILNEWQGIASQEYSTAAHFDELTQLIISWRKLELTTWPRLFDLEDDKCKKAALSWWFFLYESVIANPLHLLHQKQDLREHSVYLLSSLMAFFATSSVGQFLPRLQLLRVFERHLFTLLKTQPGLEVMHRSLHNFIRYHSQYEAPVLAAVAKGRKKATKEVSDVVLLASWKDTNIVALRDSAKRSHHKLYKAVRRYRVAIDTSAMMILQGSMPKIENEVANHYPIPDAMSFDAKLVQQEYSRLIKSWEQRPARLRDVPAVTRMMLRVSKVPEEKMDYAEVMDEYSKSIIETITELQKETPGTLTGENKEAIKHLKSRKRKAFTDTMKDLRQMGITSNPSRAVLQKQASTEHILSHGASILENTDVVDITGIQSYFVRLVESINKARNAVKDHSEDLERTEVGRCVGFLEHMLSINLEHRKMFSAALSDFVKLRETMQKVDVLADLAVQERVLYGADVLTVESVDAAKKRFRWLPKLLDLTSRLVKTHSEFTAQEFPEIDGVVAGWKDSASALDQKLTASAFVHENIWQAETKAVVTECVEFLTKIQAQIVEVITKSPEIKYTIQPLLEWVSRRETPTTADAIAEESTTLEQLDNLLEKLSDSVLVALQQLKNAQVSQPVDTETAGWLVAHQAASSAGLTALHMGNVTRKIAEALAFAARLKSIAGESAAVRAVFASYAPIIREFVTICHRTIQAAAANGRATCKATFVLCTTAATLFTKGFCQPADENDGEEGPAGVESGTGLGDGEGAEDISKDVGDDEDLSEVAQEKNEEKNDEEIEDEKDAVDMGQDEMEGEMGDMEEKDDKEDGEDGEGSDEEMDDEVGDVDDLDPTAVDEKMWDGDGEEEDKEKESEDAKGKQAEGDESEAKRDGQKGDKGDDAEEPEEGNSDDEGEGEGEDQEDDVRQQDAEGMDEHVPEVDTLDLPDDLQLDEGDESEGEGEDENGDLNMDDLSDADNDDEPLNEDGDIDPKEEKFPELEDGQENPENLDQKDGEEEEGEDEGEEKEEKGDGVEDEEDEPMGDDPAEEDKLLETQTREEEDKSKEAEETAPSEAQAAQGGADANDNQEQASAQQEQGEESKADVPEQGQGTDNSESAEQEQKAGQASQQDQDPAQQKDQNEEEKSEKQSEFQKVGDILEKWHRQRREILQAPEEDKEERPPVDDMEIDDPEFEHVPDDNTRPDTQALGAATQEQASALDDSMAIDSGDKEHLDAFEDDEDQKPEDDKTAPAEPLEHPQDAAEDKPEGDEEATAGAMIGESKDSTNERKELPFETEDQMDLDLDDDSADHPSHDPSTTITLPITRPHTEARDLWQHYESSTKTLSAGLCEQLRLILEPTQATKMRGDYRTGKRLNMRRILPYIASEYKKDKIWMRRAKPSKRQYQVILAVDDSKSMAEGASSELALETVALVSRALSSLEVGQISVLSFGETTRVVHGFDAPFTSDSGVTVFENFTFSQQKTDVRALIETSLSLFTTARNTNSGSAELWQLEIVISDGVCEDHEMLRRLVRKAQEQRVMIVFVVVDSVRENSILELNSVKFLETGEIKTERYLDSFPFGYYLVVRDVRELPGVLSGALRQWFAESVESSG